MLALLALIAGGIIGQPTTGTGTRPVYQSAPVPLTVGKGQPVPTNVRVWDCWDTRLVEGEYFQSVVVAWDLPLVDGVVGFVVTRETFDGKAWVAPRHNYVMEPELRMAVERIEGPGTYRWSVRCVRDWKQELPWR